METVGVLSIPVTVSLWFRAEAEAWNVETAARWVDNLPCETLRAAGTGGERI